MSDSLILTKAKAFAIRVVRLHKYLREKRGTTGGGAYEGSLIGCTVFANLADTGTAGAYNAAATNTILWANRNVGGKTSNWSKGTYGHCVLYPNAEGEMNTDRDPLLYSVPPAISHRNTRCVDRAGKYFLEYAG